MASLNKLFLAGNLTRDPELRYTSGGTPVAGFGLAVNRKWKDKDGNVKEEVLFIDVEAWGNQGESVAKYLRKGSPALVEGRLKLDTWEAKDTGEKRSKIRAVAERVHFLGNGSGGNGSQAQSRGAGSGTGGTQGLPAEEDMPF